MSEVDTSVSSEGSISITMDGTKHIEHDLESGISALPESGDIEFTSEPLEDTEVETEGNEGLDEAAEAPEDLGAFDPEDTEKWEARYKGEDGKLNEQALSVEFWANANGDSPGSLNEGTYAYLESIGISTAMAKNVEAALVTQQDAAKTKVSNRDGALFALAGRVSGDEANGDKALSAALKWGKEGGYTAAQQKRFNEVLKGKDDDARAEAVELLMNRYAASGAAPKANPKPALPKRDATNGRGAPGGSGLKPFKNKEEARQARREAGTNQAARQLVAKRLALGYASE